MQSGENFYGKSTALVAGEVSKLRSDNRSLSKEITRLQAILDEGKTDKIVEVKTKLDECQKKFAENNKKITELMASYESKMAALQKH